MRWRTDAGLRIVEAPPTADGRVISALVFGGGAAHETIRDRGAHHLLEHVVAAAAREHLVDGFNAWVGPATTTYVGVGEESAVLAWMRALCAALCEPPMATVERERRVLRAEARQRIVGDPTLRLRFGLRGVGLLDGGEEYGFRHLDVERLDELARGMHTLENAVFVTTGDPSKHVVDLPHGEPVSALAVPVSALGLPGWLLSDDVVLTGVARRRLEASRVTYELLAATATESLRHVDGAVYGVDFGATTCGLDVDHVRMGAVCQPADQQRVAEGLYRSLESIGNGGAGTVFQVTFK